MGFIFTVRSEAPAPIYEMGRRGGGRAASFAMNPPEGIISSVEPAEKERFRVSLTLPPGTRVRRALLKGLRAICYAYRHILWRSLAGGTGRAFIEEQEVTSVN